MAIFERIPVTVGGGSGRTGGGITVQTIAGNPLDVAFLDALYAAGKLSAAQRESLLAGADPSTFGLNPYDLYALTAGRLGSKGVAGGGPLPLIGGWNANTTYHQGQIVTFQPSPTQQAGLYQALVEVPAATPPTNTTSWQVLVNPGPQVLFDGEALCPALPAVPTPTNGITAMQTTNGDKLNVITVPPGRLYRVSISGVRPASRGGSMPSDSTILVQPMCNESLNADQTVSLVITPRWLQAASAPNSSVGAVAAGALAARVCVVVI